MDERWKEYSRRIAEWQSNGATEQLQLLDLYFAGGACHETEPYRSLELFTRARDGARKLNEPWWVLFFESWRLNALTSYANDFTKALPLAMEMMVLFNKPEGQAHSFRGMVLDNVLYTYISIDPRGYRNEIDRGLAYLDGSIEQGPVSGRLVLHQRWLSYLCATECWQEAHQLAMQSFALIDRLVDSSRMWYGAWVLYSLCRTCHKLGTIEELAGHADVLEDFSKKHRDLRRTHADAWFWRALTQQVCGDEMKATRSFHRGMTLLEGLERRDTICADPMAAYYEACGDIKAAIGVRDRELLETTRKGMSDRTCQVQIERCKLLAQLGELAPEDLNAARSAAMKLREPHWFLERIDRLTPTR